MDASTYDAALDLALVMLGILACGLMGIVALSYFNQSDRDSWP